MAGNYEVVAIYTAKDQATFKLSVGTMDAMKAGSAPSLTVQLPAQVSTCVDVMLLLEGYTAVATAAGCLASLAVSVHERV